MKNNLWVFVAIICGFTGFLLGYSTPPMLEVGLGGGPGEVVEAADQDSSSEQDLADYYKQLQDLQ